MKGILIWAIPVVAIVCGYFMSGNGFLFGLTQMYIDFMFSDVLLFLQCANMLLIVKCLYEKNPIPWFSIGWTLLFWIIVLSAVVIPSFPFEINVEYDNKITYVLLRSLYDKII